MAAIRFEFIDAAAAAIATVALIDYEIVAKNKKFQIITEYKVFCEKARVASSIDTKPSRSFTIKSNWCGWQERQVH